MALAPSLATRLRRALDGELAGLRDRGTGGMAPLAAPRARHWPHGAVSVWRLLGVRCASAAAVARQGLRAAGSAPWRASGSRRYLSWYGQSLRCARPSATPARRFCMRGAQAARRAPRALEAVEKLSQHREGGQREGAKRGANGPPLPYSLPTGPCWLIRLGGECEVESGEVA